MENKVRVMLLAHGDAGDGFFNKWKKRFLDIFDNTMVEFVTTDADILVFLTNGSAVNAIEEVRKNTSKHYILMAVASDKAYSSAVEVKAWMNQNSISSQAIVEYDSSETNKLVADLYDAKNAFTRIDKRRIYVPCNHMNEMVASDISPLMLESYFGVQLGYKSEELAASLDIRTCAGDVCSTMGMLLANELCGQVPRVMEVSKLTASSITFEACEASAVLADSCGIKATYLDSLNSEVVTVFRFDNTFSKAFVKTVKVDKRTESPLTIDLSMDNLWVDYFMNSPFGSHHLVLSGDYADKLAIACIMKRIAVV